MGIHQKNKQDGSDGLSAIDMPQLDQSSEHQIELQQQQQQQQQSADQEHQTNSEQQHQEHLTNEQVKITKNKLCLKINTKTKTQFKNNYLVHDSMCAETRGQYAKFR